MSLLLRNFTWRSRMFKIAELSFWCRQGLWTPLVSLRVRIIGVNEAVSNNTSKGEIILDANGVATKKMELILRDASGGIRATFWIIPDNAVREMELNTCIEFKNVQLSRASDKSGDLHWLKVNIVTNTTFKVIEDDGCIPITLPTRIVEPAGNLSEFLFRFQKRDPVSSSPTKRDRDDVV